MDPELFMQTANPVRAFRKASGMPFRDGLIANRQPFSLCYNSIKSDGTSGQAPGDGESCRASERDGSLRSGESRGHLGNRRLKQTAGFADISELKREKSAAGGDAPHGSNRYPHTGR